jgi:hypothetical protein
MNSTIEARLRLAHRRLHESKEFVITVESARGEIARENAREEALAARLVENLSAAAPNLAAQEFVRGLEAVGGGFTTECAEPVARILEPPAPGFSYTELGVEDVIASEWAETSDSFNFVADLDGLVRSPGVYMFHVWQGEGISQLSRVLVELSAWQR